MKILKENDRKCLRKLETESIQRKRLYVRGADRLLSTPLLGRWMCVRLFVGIFAELCEDADGAFRMQESNLQTVSALAGSLVDEADTLAVALSESFSHAVLDAESDMMNAATAVVEILLNSAFWACGLQQFQLHFANLQEGGLDLLVFNNFGLVALQTQNVFEIGKNLVNALHGDAQMFNL